MFILENSEKKPQIPVEFPVKQYPNIYTPENVMYIIHCLRSILR